MPGDVIPLRQAVTRPKQAPVGKPDPAFASLGLFRQLQSTGTEAVRFLDACRRWERRRRWGVPPLFFMVPKVQAEYAAIRPTRVAFPEPFAIPVARKFPREATAWASLRELTDDTLTILAGSIEARRAARVIPGLGQTMEQLAPHHRGCAQVAQMLRVPDDLIVTVLHPIARRGWRFRMQGITDLAQFQILLADAVTGAAGISPRSRPDARVVSAYRDGAVDPEAEIATACFQMYRLEALQAGGTLPARFQDTQTWLWGHECPTAISERDGERILLIGDPPYPRTWPIERRLPMLMGELQLLEAFRPEVAADHLRKLAGTAPRPTLRRAA